MQQRSVKHVAGHGAGGVQRGSHSDYTETRNRTVGGLNPHGAGDGGGLTDRATGVGTYR